MSKEYTKQEYIKIGAALVGTIFLFVADRFLKNLALTLDNKIILIKNWLELELFENKNIAFSIKIPEFIIIPIIILIIILLIYYLVKFIKLNFGVKEASLLLIIAGAISNLYDRLQFSYVIDYINIPFWPVFNLADIMISVGVVGLIWTLLSTKYE